MADWDMTSSDEEENDERIISLDDLESLEHAQEHRDDPFYDEDDWGDSYDDLDGEAWERQYRQDDEKDIEPDPWDLG